MFPEHKTCINRIALLVQFTFKTILRSSVHASAMDLMSKLYSDVNERHTMCKPNDHLYI